LIRALAILLAAMPLIAQTRVVPLPGKSPLVTFRYVFTVGSAADPEGKPGLAYLTAMMLAHGGTRDLTYKQIVEAMYPMATSVSAQVDKEMTTFAGETHVDNLEEYYKLFRAIVMEPGWREEDFKRVKDDAINFLRVSVRSNNDEELGKEVLYETIYAGTPYGHYSPGKVSSLEKLTLDDLKGFYRTQYVQANLILGLAGGFSPQFLEKVKKDVKALPEGAGFKPRHKQPALINQSRLVIVDKDTRSVAYSIGFPISVKRGDPDYPALLLAQSYFGQHRQSGGRLYDRIRERRGINYGDYAYIEYFPRGMFLFEPDPNLARKLQIFQIWIRPVEPPTAVFSLRLAMFELDKLIKEGISEESFQRTREFLSKYVNILTKTKRAELGYAIDSLYYGMPEYNKYIKAGLEKLTRAEVNRVIKRYLRTERLVVVAVSKDGEAFKAQLTGNSPSSMKYNAPKADEITTEDKIVEKWPLNLKAESATVIPVSKVFE
jgi:zinc protease